VFNLAVFDTFSTLSVLMTIFPGGPGLASTRMSSVWILLEIRIMDVVVTTGAMRRANCCL